MSRFVDLEVIRDTRGKKCPVFIPKHIPGTPVVATDNKHLKEIIKSEIEAFGNNCDLNHVDVSKVEDMSWMFTNSLFNGNISKWNVSNVRNMSDMFNTSSFNGDISKWNVSNVTNMFWMFNNSKFNGDISKWNVSNATDMSWMFNGSPLEKNPPKWYK